MKALPFEYHAPRSLAEGLDQLAEFADQAKVLAGGQSLVPLLNFHLARPEHIVDVNSISELDGWTIESDVLILKALVRHTLLERSPDPRWSALSRVASLIGHPAIRTRGTVVGSLAHADPAAEWPAVFSCWPGCTLTANSRRGIHRLEVKDLFAGYLTTVLEPDEILTELHIPSLPAGHRFGFAEYSRRHGDFALAAAAVVLPVHPDRTCGRLRLVLAGVGDRPVTVETAAKLLEGKPLERSGLNQVREAVRAAVTPTADIHGSSDFRRALATEVAAAAIEDAANG